MPVLLARVVCHELADDEVLDQTHKLAYTCGMTTCCSKGQTTATSTHSGMRPMLQHTTPHHTTINQNKNRQDLTNLLIKPFNPPLQILQLRRPQITTIIQRPIQILRQHLLIKTLTRQPPRRIPPRKVLVWSARPIEVSPPCYVVDFSFYGEVDFSVRVEWGVLLAVEL